MSDIRDYAVWLRENAQPGPLGRHMDAAAAAIEQRDAEIEKLRAALREMRDGAKAMLDWTELRATPHPYDAWQKAKQAYDSTAALAGSPMPEREG